MTPVPSLAPDNCLFLDLDGTLLALRDDPAMVRADPELRTLLQDCTTRLGGALAIVSGRRIVDLDACFAPLQLAAAGIHGLERRSAEGVMTRPPTNVTLLRSMAQQLQQEMEKLPMAQLEDKGASLALHWRRAPQHAHRLRALASRALRQLGPGFRLQEGNHVVELLPGEANKGKAVQAFMKEAPFAGRRPVFVGDDLTDVPGFAAAHAAGGYGIAVGTAVTADYQLRDVDAVRRWLGDIHA